MPRRNCRWKKMKRSEGRFSTALPSRPTAPRPDIVAAMEQSDFFAVPRLRRRKIITTAKLIALSLFGAASMAAGQALAQPAADGGRKFSTPMSGAEEVSAAFPTGGAGDPDGTGTGSITVNVGQDRVCWEFTNVANIIAPNRGHIHKAPALSNGAIVVDFFNVDPTAAGPLTGCTTTP